MRVAAYMSKLPQPGELWVLHKGDFDEEIFLIIDHQDPENLKRRYRCNVFRAWSLKERKLHHCVYKLGTDDVPCVWTPF